MGSLAFNSVLARLTKCATRSRARSRNAASTGGAEVFENEISIGSINRIEIGSQTECCGPGCGADLVAANISIDSLYVQFYRCSTLLNDARENRRHIFFNRIPMFSIIITLVAIVLVVGLALAAMYFGGTAYFDAGDRAAAVRIINSGTQVFSAAELYSTSNGSWPTSMEALVTSKYLKAVPEADWEVNWGTGGHDLFLRDVTSAHCMAVNQLSSRVKEEFSELRPQIAAQCVRSDEDRIVFFFGNRTPPDERCAVARAVFNKPDLPCDAGGDPVAGRLTAIPSELNFGTVLADPDAPSTNRLLTLVNKTADAISPWDLEFDGPWVGDWSTEFYLSGEYTCGPIIEPGVTCQVMVGFWTENAGNAEGWIVYDGRRIARLTGRGDNTLPMPDLEIYPPYAYLGAIQQGHRVLEYSYIYVTNMSAQDVPFTPSVTGGFSIAWTDCSDVIAAGESCEVDITTDTGAIGHQTGAFSLGGTTSQLSADILPAVSPLTLSPKILRFDEVKAGETAYGYVQVVNSSYDSVSFSPEFPSGFSRADPGDCPAQLTSGARCSMRIDAPTSVAGSYSGQLRANGAEVSLLLTVAKASPYVSLSTEYMEFANVAKGSAPTLAVSVTNHSDNAVALVPVVPAKFFLVPAESANCGAQLGPWEQCNYAFSPDTTADGRFEGVFNLNGVTMQLVSQVLPATKWFLNFDGFIQANGTGHIGESSVQRQCPQKDGVQLVMLSGGPTEVSLVGDSGDIRMVAMTFCLEVDPLDYGVFTDAPGGGLEPYTISRFQASQYYRTGAGVPTETPPNNLDIFAGRVVVQAGSETYTIAVASASHLIMGVSHTIYSKISARPGNLSFLEISPTIGVTRITPD